MMDLLSTLLFLQVQAISPTDPAQTEGTKGGETVAQIRSGSGSVMVIDPKSRAADYVQAFNLLKREKSASKMIFHLSNGEKISRVIDMNIMPNNTVVLFRYNTAQGVMLRVVEIEAIEGIELQ